MKACFFLITKNYKISTTFIKNIVKIKNWSCVKTAYGNKVNKPVNRKKKYRITQHDLQDKINFDGLFIKTILKQRNKKTNKFNKNKQKNLLFIYLFSN